MAGGIPESLVVGGGEGGVDNCEVGGTMAGGILESLVVGDGGGGEITAEVKGDTPGGTAGRQRSVWSQNMSEHICRFASTMTH